MNEKEKRKYEAFQYWIQTNTERGVTTIPDNLCLFVINLIKSLQKENTEFEKLSKDCSYSVDIVRENTRLRRQVFDLELENEELKGQYAEYVKLTCNEVAKNSELNSESNSAIKEKNKIINAMSKYIAKLDIIDEDICKYINCGEGDKEREECIECVIKYFENK